jgi:hypothetical protein
VFFNSEFIPHILNIGKKYISFITTHIMPTLTGELTEEKCPDCLSRGKDSKLVLVSEMWNMEEEGEKLVEMKQCPCGYRYLLFDEMPLLHEPSEQEFRALRGESVDGYRVSNSFRWIHDYFRNYAA